MATAPRLNIARGQSLIEVLISVAFIAIMSGTMLTLLSGRLQSGLVTRSNLRATTLADEGLEAVKWIRDSGWDALTPGTHGLQFVSASSAWRLQVQPDVTDSTYTRTLTITDTAENERSVSVSIDWLSQLNRPQNITLNTVLTNWRRTAAPLLSGNWLNPISQGSIDLGPGNSAMGLAVTSSKVYIVATAADKKKHDFYVIDVTDGANPLILSSINVGEGLNEIAVSGTYAYVASSDSNNHLQLVSFSNPNDPTLTTSFALAGNAEEAISVGLLGNLAFVGTALSSSPEFYVIDVSNPLNPILKGTLEIGADVNQISIIKDRVYIGTSHDTQEVIEIDPTTSTAPRVVATLDLPGTQDVNDLNLNDQTYLGFAVRTYSSGASTPELVTIDLSKKDAPAIFGTAEMSQEMKAVYPVDDLVFTSAGDSNMEFQLFQIVYPANATFYSGLNFPQDMVDFAFATNTVYAAVRSNDALRIITSGD